MRLTLIRYFVFAFFSAASASAVAEEPVASDRIPIKADIGFGYGEYTFHQTYDTKNPVIKGTELAIEGVVDQSVIEKYKSKIPEKFQKPASKLNEVSATHVLIPKTLYIHPSDGDKTAFGATWGFVPSISGGFKYLQLGLSAGIIATAMYYHDTQIDDSVYFVRPGLRASASLSIPLFNRYLAFEGGLQQDAYLPQHFFAEKSVWHVSGRYLMVHFRIPMSVKAKL